MPNMQGSKDEKYIIKFAGLVRIVLQIQSGHEKSFRYLIVTHYYTNKIHNESPNAIFLWPTTDFTEAFVFL